MHYQWDATQNQKRGDLNNIECYFVKGNCFASSRLNVDDNDDNDSLNDSDDDDGFDGDDNDGFDGDDDDGFDGDDNEDK